MTRHFVRAARRLHRSHQRVAVTSLGKKRQMSEINVVPYIDVMLVLLVVFMITAPLITQGVQVDLPKASTKPIKNQKAKPLEVTVDKHGNYFYSASGNPRKPVNETELAQWAARDIKKHKGSPVLVRGHKNVRYELVIKAMAILQADRSFRDDIGRLTMIRIFNLLGKGSDIAASYRRRMFAFMH